MSRKPDGSAFRSWLVERLVTSRWPIYQDDTEEKIAKRIGVQLDVLQEAKEVYRERQAKHLDKPARLGMPRAKRRSRFMVFLEPPEAVYVDWAAHCKHRDQTNACMLRSVIHHMLRLKWQPSWLGSRHQASWYYQGKWLGQTRIREHRFRIKTDLGEPCYRALTKRALASGVTSSAIVRWGVVSLLEGKLRNLSIVTSLDSLYNEPVEYCLMPSIIQEKLS